MNVCPGEGVAYDSYYNETDRVIHSHRVITKVPSLTITVYFHVHGARTNIKIKWLHTIQQWHVAK